MTDLISQYVTPPNNGAALRFTKRWATALLSSAIVFMLFVALPVVMQTLRR